MFRYVLGILILILTGYSCKVLKTSSKDRSEEFSILQSELISSGAIDEAMRVYKINNHQDSLLLRMISDSVIFEINDAKLDVFVARLLATVQDSASLGVGIAAPQVGILKKIIWVQRFDKEEFPFEVYYNPDIIEYSEETQPCMEGCLSIPDKQGDTGMRAKRVLISYQDRQGLEYQEWVEDFTAVIFQHEIDHLDGILFTDHLDSEQ